MMGLLGCAAALSWGADATELKDAKEKFSYAVGMSMGAGWKRQYIDIDLEVMIKGLKDAQGGKTLLTDAEALKIIRDFQSEHNAWLAEKHKKDGEAFLAENKQKDGVVVLPSGLQYKVLAEGKGESPKTNDLVTVNYRGTFIDGTEFDSSYKNNQPATLSLGRGGVIDGWREALPLMKPGAKWQLFIPANLAYGQRGNRGIPPNAALIFEVELISSESPKPARSEPVTSDIIRVPSKEEMDKGAQPQVIKPADLEKIKAQEKEKADKEKADKEKPKPENK
jgi:FKBP-type peptidyl-prolyl cis-trans isomerase FklB